MRRAVLVFCLMISIGLQGVAHAGQILGSDRSGGTAHSVLHADGIVHHHDDDGTVHKDASKKSKQHVQNDCCSSVAGMPPSPTGAETARPPARAPDKVAREGQDSPFLEGLKRPPRTSA